MLAPRRVRVHILREGIPFPVGNVEELPPKVSELALLDEHGAAHLVLLVRRARPPHRDRVAARPVHPQLLRRAPEKVPGAVNLDCNPLGASFDDRVDRVPSLEAPILPLDLGGHLAAHEQPERLGHVELQLRRSALARKEGFAAALAEALRQLGPRRLVTRERGLLALPQPEGPLVELEELLAPKLRAQLLAALHKLWRAEEDAAGRRAEHGKRPRHVGHVLRIELLEAEPALHGEVLEQLLLPIPRRRERPRNVREALWREPIEAWRDACEPRDGFGGNPFEECGR